MLRHEVKIVVYQQGKKTTLSPQSPHFKKLQQKCEEFLTSATKVMRDYIRKEKVLPIKKKELAVEVIYRRPKEIKIPRFDKARKGNHLLIPLTGNYVDTEDNIGTHVFFYGPGYGPDYTGPYWAERDVEEIEQLLVLMGIEINQEEGKQR